MSTRGIRILGFNHFNRLCAGALLRQRERRDEKPRLLILIPTRVAEF